MVEVFSPIIYGWCRKSGLAGQDAADVVQDVFVTVAKGIHRFDRHDAQSSFRAWLSTITRTRLADHFSRIDKQARGIGGTDAMQRFSAVPDVGDDSDSQMLSSMTLAQQTLRSIESEFEATTWSAFWQLTMENRTAAEVAASLGLNIASVYQAKSRVLRRLKQRLAELP